MDWDFQRLLGELDLESFDSESLLCYQEITNYRDMLNRSRSLAQNHLMLVMNYGVGKEERGSWLLEEFIKERSDLSGEK